MTTTRPPSLKMMQRRREWCEQMANLPGSFHATKTIVSVNHREHWTVRSARVKRERRLGWAIGILQKNKELPLRVTFTRYSCRLTDSDSTPTAFKATRDGIADAFGVDDSPRTAIEWVYRQEKSPVGCFGFRVLIEEVR